MARTRLSTFALIEVFVGMCMLAFPNKAVHSRIRLWAAKEDLRLGNGCPAGSAASAPIPFSPIPTTGANRLCARCTEGRQRLRDVYMSFMLRDGWYCQFLEADLKAPLPQKFTFATPEKSAELAERGRALKDLATKQALEHGIQTGRGGVYLHLTPWQYNN